MAQTLVPGSLRIFDKKPTRLSPPYPSSSRLSVLPSLHELILIIRKSPVTISAWETDKGRCSGAHLSHRNNFLLKKKKRKKRKASIPNMQSGTCSTGHIHLYHIPLSLLYLVPQALPACVHVKQRPAHPCRTFSSPSCVVLLFILCLWWCFALKYGLKQDLNCPV